MIEPNYGPTVFSLWSFSIIFAVIIAGFFDINIKHQYIATAEEVCADHGGIRLFKIDRFSMTPESIVCNNRAVFYKPYPREDIESRQDG